MVHVGVTNPHVNTANGLVIEVGQVKDERESPLLSEFPESTHNKSVGGMSRGGNGFNILLESTTVAEKTRSIMIQALRQMGYRTVRKCDEPCTKLSASLRTFIVKAPFNFWRAMSFTQHMIADISVDVTLQSRNNDTQFTVTGHGSNIYQVIDKDNWETAINRAIKHFVRNFKRAMAAHAK